MKLDISEVLAAEANARALLSGRAVAGVMKPILDNAARIERGDHDYNNRTRNLQTHTKAVQEVASNELVRIILGMFTDYASFVRAKGLTTIDGAAALGEAQIKAAFEQLASKVK